MKLAAASRRLFVHKVYFWVLSSSTYNLHEFVFDVSYFFEENITVYKLLLESFILAFRIMYFAGLCCKHCQCDVLRHHHCFATWSFFIGCLRQCVDLSCEGRNVCELRICRKKYLWKTGCGNEPYHT